jgi:hypothetical protein
MADAKTTQKRGRSSERDSDNRQDGNLAVGAGTDDSGTGETVGERDILTWAEFDKKLYKWEAENMDKRITRVMFDGDCPTDYSGKMSEAPIGFGKPSIRLSTGEIIEI